MKKYLLLFVVLLFGMNGSDAQDSYVLDENQEIPKQVIQLKVGTTYEYTQRHNPSTAFYTELLIPDSCAVSLLSTSFEYDKSKPPRPGMSGTKKSVFIGEYPGTCTIHVLLKRVNDTISNTAFVFEVVE